MYKLIIKPLGYRTIESMQDALNKWALKKSTPFYVVDDTSGIFKDYERINKEIFESRYNLKEFIEIICQCDNYEYRLNNQEYLKHIGIIEQDENK